MTGASAWPLFGHERAEEEILATLATGRLHHAWLIEGPSGIGKARLAKRFAARLLGARTTSGRNLDSESNDPVVEKMLAGGHPDFRYLAREPNEKGKLPLFIPVDQVRDDLVNFFNLKPALGGKRVAVLDAVDELNASGANALLKSLEEPPAHCVLILIYHGERPILPTIRSRCRRLRLSILDDAPMQQALDAASVTLSNKVRALSQGRPGRAIALSEQDGLTGLSAAASLLSHFDAGGLREVPTLFSSASKSDASFSAFSAGVLNGLSERAVERPDLAKAWLWVTRLLEQANRDSMDRGQTTAKLVSGLQEYVRDA